MTVYWDQVTPTQWQAFKSPECDEDSLIGSVETFEPPDEDEPGYKWELYEYDDGEETANKGGVELSLDAAKYELEHEYVTKSC